MFGGYDNNLKSISTGYLLNDDATKAPIRENSDNYPRSYNGLSKVIPNTNARVISYTESFASWDETTLKISLMVIFQQAIIVSETNILQPNHLNLQLI